MPHGTSAAEDIHLGRVLFRETAGQARWAPLSVDTRSSCWTNALKLLATMILNLLVMTDATDVVAVLELARYAHQIYLTVFDRPRVFAVV